MLAGLLAWRKLLHLRVHKISNESISLTIEDCNIWDLVKINKSKKQLNNYITGQSHFSDRWALRVVFLHWVVILSVVGNEKRPASPVAMVLVATMKNIAVEKECIAWIQFYIHERKYLENREKNR